MTIGFFAQSFAAILMGISPATAQEATSSARVGVLASPCASVPQAPQIVADFGAAMARAVAARQPPPVPSAKGLAAYNEWQKQLLLADFANFCKYDAANQTLGPPTPLRIVFMGDSITEAWKDARPTFFGGDRVNRGISGQTTVQMLVRFQADVIALKPELVHILAGTNDIAGNTGPTTLVRIEGNLEAMVDLATAHGIKVAIGTVLPTSGYNWRPTIVPGPSIIALNSWIRRYAKDRGLILIDYYKALDDGRGALIPVDSSDGVHPTSAGYVKMEAAFDRSLPPAERH